MKKLISVFLVLALCAAGCAFAEAPDVTGDWYLNVIESEGEQLDPVLMEMDMVLTLNADGSAEIKRAAAAESSSWRMDGSKLIITAASGETLVACPDGGNLEIEDAQNGWVMILGREKQETQSYVPAQVIADPAMQDFLGSWNAAFVDMMGMQLPMDALGMKLMLDIAEDIAVVIRNDGDEDISYVAPLKLEGGGLTVEAVDDWMPIKLQLQQDGRLVYAEETEGLVMTMYFEKTA